MACGRALFGPDATMHGNERASAPVSRISFSSSQAIFFSVIPGLISWSTRSNAFSASSRACLVFSISSSSLISRRCSTMSSVGTSLGTHPRRRDDLFDRLKLFVETYVRTRIPSVSTPAVSICPARLLQDLPDSKQYQNSGLHGCLQVKAGIGSQDQFVPGDKQRACRFITLGVLSGKAAQIATIFLRGNQESVDILFFINARSFSIRVISCPFNGLVS